MQFASGIATGLAASALIMALYAAFSREANATIGKVVASSKQVAGRQKGYVLEPDTEIDEARREVLKRNAEMGRDTPISELIHPDVTETKHEDSAEGQ